MPDATSRPRYRVTPEQLHRSVFLRKRYDISHNIYTCRGIFFLLPESNSGVFGERTRFWSFGDRERFILLYSLVRPENEAK